MPQVLDDLHYNLSKLLSYNKAFNFVVSAREAGKTTAIWLGNYKIFKKKGKPTLVIRRLIADITETYIGDIQNVLNKFLPEPIELKFKKGSIKEGVVDVFIEDKLFFRVIALSNPMMRIKSLMLPNIGRLFFDEFICNTKLGEKYIENETFKFSELYNTFQRESEGPLVCIFAGNPYSIYNPYFAWIGVPLKKLYPGSFAVGDKYCVEVYELSKELKEFILARNPLYQFDDSYRKYAFDGRAINDQYVNIEEKQPDNFSLKFVFYIERKYVGVYAYNGDGNWSNVEYYYWLSTLDDYQSKRRNIACFDLSSLIEGTYLISREDRMKFAHLKQAFRQRKCAFKTIEEEYLIETVFPLI